MLFALFMLLLVFVLFFFFSFSERRHKLGDRQTISCTLGLSRLLNWPAYIFTVIHAYIQYVMKLRFKHQFLVCHALYQGKKIDDPCNISRQVCITSPFGKFFGPYVPYYFLVF